MTGNLRFSFIKSAWLVGAASAAGLSAAYWLVLYLITRDPVHPWQQFILYKYWMSALIVGFGVQAGLFWRLRSLRHKIAAATSAVAASAGTSTAAMVVCCVHHLVDFLPLLGFSAAALFLSKYQAHFLLLGMISNLFGIGLMIYQLQLKKNKLPVADNNL